MTEKLNRRSRLLSLIKITCALLALYSFLYLFMRSFRTDYSPGDLGISDSRPKERRIYFFLDDKKTWYQEESSMPKVVAWRFSTETFLTKMFAPLMWVDYKITGSVHGLVYLPEQAH